MLLKTFYRAFIPSLLNVFVGATAVGLLVNARADQAFGAYGDVQVAASLEGAEASGVVVDHSGRMFLTLPRVGKDHSLPSVVEIVDGKPVPFPDVVTTEKSDRPLTDWLVSPLGMTEYDGTLWVLDEGKRPDVQGIPQGSAKLVAINVQSRKVTKTIVFDAPFLRDTMQLNDLRFDPTHGSAGTIYISNNGYSRPDSSLIVVDVASGNMTEHFRNAAEVSPTPGFMSFVEGLPHASTDKPPTMPGGGINGIELSPDYKTLYWTTPTNPNYYSVPTAALSDPSIDDSTLRKATHWEGQTVSNGGITIDDRGNLYFGDASRDAIIRRDAMGRFSLVARDPRLIWPDGLYYQAGYLYVTIGQWQRAPNLNGGKDRRKPPYQVLKIRVEFPKTQQ